MYRNESEFAKEAMGNQSLDQNEILCIRWAHDDPNPVAQDSINRADRDALYALLKAKGISLDNAGFEYPAEYSLPSAKKLRLENGVDVTAQFPELAYPDTDQQYAAPAVTTTAAPASMTQEEYAKYCEAYYAAYMAEHNLLPSAEAPSSAGEAVSSSSAQQDARPAGSAQWVKCVDEETGATYYFNEATQEASWGVPAEMSSGSG